MVSTRQSSNSSCTSNVTNSEAVINEAGKSNEPVTHRRSQQQPQANVANYNCVQINLLNLPLELQQKILSYLDYNTIAHLRPICHQMDKVCGSVLNSTFQRLQNQMHSRFQAIKAQMPRRESARRNHPLACESDIIETLHMRLTLLQMSFGKHIERKHCCFFPGGILDEVYRILHYIKVTPKLARPYKVTDELFDLSTMAMEYFKDCIEPKLPEIPYFGADFLDLGVPFSSSSSVSKFSLCLDSSSLSATDGKSQVDVSCDSFQSQSNDENSSMLLDSSIPPPVTPPQSNMVLRKRIRKIKQGMKRYNDQLTLMRRDLRNCKGKIAEQQKQLIEYATRMDEHDKKNEETSRKFSTLLQELNKCKTELQYWRSKSPAIPVCFGCGQAMPVPTEDLQALVNQGILPNIEANTNEANRDFIPIAKEESVVKSPTEKELGIVLEIQPQLQQPNDSSSTSSAEMMAPPKVPSSLPMTSTTNSTLTSSKRKFNSLVQDEQFSNDDAMKKPRRILKSRHSKRSKT